MNKWTIIAAYWLFAVAITYIVRSINSKKSKFPFQDKKSTKALIAENLAIWFIIPLCFPFIAIYYLCSKIKKAYYKNRPRPVPKNERNFLKKDTVFDETNTTISLAEYNYKHGTNFTLDQIYGKGYEASLNDKEKKDIGASSRYGILKLSDNLLNSIYTDYSKEFGNAILSGDFLDFEDHLTDTTELILHLNKNFIGAKNIVDYWKGWREKYVVTKEITDFEVLHSNYFAHSCTQMANMLTVMHIEDGKIVKMLLVRRNLAGGSYAHHDDLVNEYPFSSNYIKRYLEPLRDENEISSPVVKINRIPCFCCGLASESLDWHSSNITVGIHRYPSLVSICPKCGKVIEYYTEARVRLVSPVIDKVDILEEYADCWNGRTIGRLGEYLADNFHYTSHWVFEELDKKGYLEYFAGKLEQIEKSNSNVKARIVDDHLVVTQNGNNVVIDVKFENNKIASACMSPASFFGIPDKEPVSKENKFNLYGLWTFFNDTPLVGSKYLELIPEDIEIKQLDYSKLGSPDPYTRKKLRTIAEECDWLFFSELSESDKDNLEKIKLCYKAAVNDGIYEAANNLGVIAINYEDNSEEGNSMLEKAASCGSQNAMINQFTFLWNNQKYAEGIDFLSKIQDRKNLSLKCLWNLAYLYFMGEDYPNNNLDKNPEKAKHILIRIISYDKNRICENEKSVQERAKDLLKYIDSSNIFSDNGLSFHDILTNSVIKTTTIKDKEEVFGRLTSLSIKEGYKLGLRLANPNTSENGDQSNFFVYNDDGFEDIEILKYITVNATAMGAWQVYLLMTSQTIMPVFWHGGYIVRKFIFKESDLNSIRPLKILDLSSLKQQGILFPSVTFNHNNKEEEYDVYCCYWNEWKGLVREHVKIQIKDGLVTYYNNEDDFILYKYDCGIFF